MGRTLTEHAAYELAKAGMTNNEDPTARNAATAVMALVRRFEKQDHDQKSADFVLNAFSTICNFLPITPITDDPDEWDKFEIDKKNVDTGELEKKVIWQSKRGSSFFSEDEGKNFVDQKTGQTVQSVDHVKQAEDVAAEKAARAARKLAADERAQNPIGHVGAEEPAGETAVTAATDPGPEATNTTAPASPPAPNVQGKKETK